ncbi:MgtC/SapB family protein [Cognatilysobacter lacus]|nr:DUF4010 domain-containing protein [Lysobacter lacus]
MIRTQAVFGLAVALGIGLLVGIERERRRDTQHPSWAGLRTFVLVALGGSLSALLGPEALVVAGAFTALAALAAWGRAAARDSGMTTGFAMLVVFLCGALAQRDPVLAAGSGVVVAVLLATKSRLHHFVRHGLTAQELHDLLLLAAAATIVLPMLPDRTIDPWDALNPRRLWLLAVVVLGVNDVSYLALRWLGTRWGLLLAGMAGGFASSTATTAAMGQLARRDRDLTWLAACAAMMSSLSTVVQLAIVTGLLAPPLLQRLAVPLIVTGLTVVGYAALAAGRSRVPKTRERSPIPGRAFDLRHALAFVAVVAAVLLISAGLRQAFGGAGLGVAVGLAGFADAHAPAASAAQLAAAGKISLPFAADLIVLAVATNAVSKIVVAASAGGAGYVLRLLPGLALMVGVFGLSVRLVPMLMS